MTHRLSEHCRKEYNAMINKKFIPFLKSRDINHYDEITTPVLGDYQESLLLSGMKPQTVNNNLKPVQKVLEYLTRKGMIKLNPGRQLRYLPVQQGDKKARGCYDIDKLQGVFGKPWKDEKLFLLCMLIYTTGMRNSEIKRMCLSDIIHEHNFHFITIKESKTPNGIRTIPLHDFVYTKLVSYASKQDQTDSLFDIRSTTFSKANLELAQQLGMDKEQIKNENITFYSGRHFWKTLMNSEGLGEDIEEIFMGHKVSNDIAKRYNHRDRQGKERLYNKAKHMFSILELKMLR
jgi:integrase